MSLRERWQALAARFDALKPREQALVVLAAVLVLLVAWDTFWHGPLSQRNRQMTESNARLAQQVSALQASIAGLEARAARDPNRQIRSRLERLRAEQQRLDRRLSGLRLALIPPSEMSGLLRSVLAREPGLELVSLESLPSEVALRDEPEASDKAGEALTGEQAPEPEPLVFRHPVELRFRGRFRDALAYVRRLEGLDWRFYWQALELATDPEQGYPHTDIRLRLFTLSVDEGWIRG